MTDEENVSVPLEDALTKALNKEFEEVGKPLESFDAETPETAPEAEPEMQWPLPVYPLVAKFDVQIVELEDQNAIVLAVYTGAGATFGLLSQEGALALSSRLKKCANSMIPGK